MWFIGVEVEQEGPPPKKILDPPLLNCFQLVVYIAYISETYVISSPILFNIGLDKSATAY